MTQKHTPGKLTIMVDGIRRILCSEKMMIAATVGGNDEANAERFVSCWNACDGITNPDAVPDALKELENLIELSESAMKAANRDGSSFNIEEELKPARDAVSKAKNSYNNKKKET